MNSNGASVSSSNASLQALLARFVASFLALALLVAVGPSAAQLQLDIPRLDVPDRALLAPPQETLQRDNPFAQEPGSQGFSAMSNSSKTSSNWLGTAIQYEAPRATGDGQYTKPKVRVGLPSESLRGFLNSSGFSAEKCQLPVVRARLKADSDISGGTLWLFARCTFR